MPKTSSSTLGALIESFFTQRLIRQRQASPATLFAYKDALRLLLQFVSSAIDKPVDLLALQDIDRNRVLAFLDFLETERGNCPRTRNARLAVIHSFFRHVAFSDPTAVALAQGILGIGPKRTVKYVVGFLQPPEAEALLAAPDRRTARGRRDHALLLFLLRTGARASEAIGVDLADLSLGPRQVLIHGKGSKQRVVPLATDLAAILGDLVDERGIDARTKVPLFVDAKGKRLTRFGLTHIVRRAVRIASTQVRSLEGRPISPHTFRHTTAMRLLQAGVDLAVIRAWLGHVDIQTTHQYLEADVEMKRHALEAANVTPEVQVRFKPSSRLLALLER